MTLLLYIKEHMPDRKIKPKQQKNTKPETGRVMRNCPAESCEESITRRRIVIKGIVQGVGFRPFIYQLAGTYNIKGSVLNSSEGVIIDAEGEGGNMVSFLAAVREHPPVLSKISNIQEMILPPAGLTAFTILQSDRTSINEALIPPDMGTCAACAREILDPLDRHYQYPFTNCTGCGPRFTIIREVPYDRPKTSMRNFEMCEECAKEYNNPLDRRFHAQPVACPECGPSVDLVDPTGKSVLNGKGWLEASWKVLSQGKILALKSLGGFHLVCDAKNHDAVNMLRESKGRQAKPFAVMCRGLETTGQYCLVTAEEAGHLTSPQAPIVVLQKRPDCMLPEGLAPGLTTLGVMLPYTPLHLLLFSGVFDCLVMTSGNYKDLPLAIDNDAALYELGRIADFFLIHNREIVNRCDDSLIRVIDGEASFLRRSRGYVPYPISVKREDNPPVILGIGGEMKNNFCLLKDDMAFISQYIGEIDTFEGEKNLRKSLLNLQELIGVVPEVVAYDAHPDYASSKMAREIDAKAYIAVQHHHAHLASCMADNGLDNDETIGIILDGTGYGTDGNLWGFEILAGDYIGFRRLFHLDYVPLPGGEVSIREPWRTACSYLICCLGDKGSQYGRQIFKDRDAAIVEQMLKNRFNTPLACGCGRLFDAVSAILEIALENTYEGQAAIALGEAAIRAEKEGSQIGSYLYEIKDGIIYPGKIIAGVVEDKFSGVSVGEISLRFHKTLVHIICDATDMA